MSTGKFVIIHGYVFSHSEKSPFVKSGESVLGALEYDDEQELVRCHECGLWYAGVANHVASHSMSTREYRLKHGLKSRSSLSAPSVRHARAAAFKRTVSNPAFEVERISAVANSPTYKEQRGVQSAKTTSESANQVGRCRVQTLFRVQTLAAQLGRTPTCNELFAAGINAPTLLKHFGGYAAAIETSGLQSRRSGHSVSRDFAPLPHGFPTKQQLDETRMPWPKEYFGVQPLERRVATA